MKTILSALSFAAMVLLAVPANAQTVTVVAPWEIKSVDPSVSGFAFLRMQAGETLVDADANGVLRPGLANNWSASNDGTKWTFTLRPDVSFHDGSKFTAQAAVTALKRAKAKGGVLGKAPVESIAAEDGKVMITLSEPFAALPAALSHYTNIVFAPACYGADGSVSCAYGTGPYKVSKLSLPQSMQLERFEGYWGAAPQIEKTRYMAASRAETRALMAESGDADLVVTLDPAGYKRLKMVDRVETRVVSIPRTIVMKMNAGHPILGDVKVRQALSMAIDRDGIAKAVLGFPEAAATQLFPPVLSGWHAPDLPPLKGDADQAKAMLAELGWKASDDGILMRNGKRFSVTVRTFPSRPELPLIAAAVQEQWRQIGVELQVSIGNFSEIPGGHKDGSLDIGLYARNYGLTPDPASTVRGDFGKGGAGWGAMGWEQPAVAEAVVKVAQSADPKFRAMHIATITRALQDELPMIPIAWYQHTIAHNKKLSGVITDPLERSYGLSGASWRK